eukprot:gb/GECG01014132.1/.p1 GENE.gb/GECG01014132.1/~~gb/GECG01014132.1/.p1  ORF type:complete len:267 (+),score=31.16 gb/GECG01014132.1/:1-801(+)
MGERHKNNMVDDEEQGTIPVLQYVGRWDRSFYQYYCHLTFNLKEMWFQRKAMQEGGAFTFNAASGVSVGASNSEQYEKLTAHTSGTGTSAASSSSKPTLNDKSPKLRSPISSQRFSEDNGTVVLQIGRAKKADIRLDLPNAMITSRNHASLYIRKRNADDNTGFQCTIEDLGSLNCMYVNYAKLEKQSKKLRHGDILHFGGGAIAANESGYAANKIETPVSALMYCEDACFMRSHVVCISTVCVHISPSTRGRNKYSRTALCSNSR